MIGLATKAGRGFASFFDTNIFQVAHISVGMTLCHHHHHVETFCLAWQKVVRQHVFPLPFIVLGVFSLGSCLRVGKQFARSDEIRSVVCFARGNKCSDPRYDIVYPLAM